MAGSGHTRGEIRLPVNPSLDSLSPSEGALQSHWTGLCSWKSCGFKALPGFRPVILSPVFVYLCFCICVFAFVYLCAEGR